MCQEFVSSFVGCFWLRVSHEVAVEVGAGAGSSEDLTGLGTHFQDASLPWLANWYWFLMGALSSFLCAPWGVLESPHGMVASPEDQTKAEVLYMTRAGNHTPSPVPFSTGHTYQP